MRIVGRLALAFIPCMLIAVPSYSQEIAPIVGNWVGKGVSCKAIKDSSDERILKIRKNGVEFYEATCKIRSVKRTGSSFAVNTICEAEGEAERRNIDIDLLSNNEIKLKGGFHYVRCP